MKIVEVPKFLLEMSQQVNTQDNRMTADPIWQVKCDRLRPTAEGYSDRFQILDAENDYGVVADNDLDNEINEQIVSYLDCDPDDLPIEFEAWVDAECDDLDSGQDKIDYFIENFDHEYNELYSFACIWMEEYSDIVKTCLTEADANWFIRRKQHDYPKLYTYVESMSYCPQMIELRNWIMSLTQEPK